MLKIRHKKTECIGCRLCADTAPQYFEMDEDGMAQLLDSSQQGVFQVVDAFEEDLAELEESVEGCPVNIIHIDR